MLAGRSVTTVVPPGVSGRSLASLVSLLQLADSAFPTGRYTQSFGLEAYAQAGVLASDSPASLLWWLLTDSLRLGMATSDGAALVCAHRAVDGAGGFDLEKIRTADLRLSAVKLARESREASVRIGRALLSIAASAFKEADISDVSRLVSSGGSPGNHAVVMGVLSAKLGAPCAEAVVAEMYSFCSNWVAAAVRLGLTDHGAGQRILHLAGPVISDASVKAMSAEIDDISTCTPLVDVMSTHHEQSAVRLFSS
ncbi:MAG TPA: urease accessory UreF family protein [Acidimicrobiales bacterium]